MQPTTPDGEVYVHLSLDKTGQEARVFWGYSFGGDELHTIANLYMLVSYVMRQRMNLIGTDEEAAMEEGLRPECLPDILSVEEWRLEWEAPERKHGPTTGTVHIERSRESLNLWRSEGAFLSAHTIAPLDPGYVANLQRSPVAPYLSALDELPQAICTVAMELEGFGFRHRHVEKYAVAAVSHLWATMLSTVLGDEAKTINLRDIMELCRRTRLDPASAAILQPFHSGLLVDECLARARSWGR